MLKYYGVFCSSFSRSFAFLFSAAFCFAGNQPAFAQPVMQKQPGAVASSGEGEVVQVTLKKDAIHLMSPEEFTRSISLAPIQAVTMKADLPGAIQNVRIKEGDSVKAQQELIQIDSTRVKLQLERAKVFLKAANLRKEHAEAVATSGLKTRLSLNLAKAEVELAEADLALAQLDLKNASLRASFSGQVQVVNVAAGSLVQKGDTLLTIVDDSKLIAEIPVNRNEVKQGDTIDVQLDNKKVSGKVQAIKPLNEKWEALRKIVDSAAVAVVVIENSNKSTHVGQTVYSPIVPRFPVIEVPNLALSNSETGARIIQVVRDNLIRDIEVQLLGPLGEGRSYVSGPLQEKDELVTEVSQALADGTYIQPATVEIADKKTNPAGTANGARKAPISDL